MELDHSSAGEALDALGTCAEMLDVRLGQIAEAVVHTTDRDSSRHTSTTPD